MPYQKYPISLRIIHWITFILIVVQFTLGFLMEDEDTAIIQAHIIFGSLILCISLFRIFSRRLNKTKLPKKPTALSEKEWSLAKIGHIVLYTVLIATPLAGLAGYYIHSEDILEMHEILVWILLALIAGHISMVVVHKIRHNQNLIKRIS